MIIVLPDSAAQILAKLLTVDTDASGLNATTLQGNAPSAFDVSGAASSAVTSHVAAANPHSQYLLSSAVSAFGLTLIDDADAATARTTLGLGTMATRAAASYLLATGATTGATSQAQTLTNGVITGKVYPAADSTNSFGLFRADGTTQDLAYDSTHGALLMTPGTAANPSYSFSSSPNTGFYLVGTNRFAIAANGAFIGELRNDGTLRQLAIYGKNASSINDDCLRLYSNGTITASHAIDQTNSRYLIQAWYQGIGYDYPIVLQWNGGRVGVKNTPTAFLDTPASSTVYASLRIRTGVAPTSPNDGDIYQDGTHAYMRIGGAWKQLDN